MYSKEDIHQNPPYMLITHLANNHYGSLPNLLVNPTHLGGKRVEPKKYLLTYAPHIM